jgi:hypothetical protein
VSGEPREAFLMLRDWVALFRDGSRLTDLTRVHGWLVTGEKSLLVAHGGAAKLA